MQLPAPQLMHPQLTKVFGKGFQVRPSWLRPTPGPAREYLPLTEQQVANVVLNLPTPSHQLLPKRNQRPPLPDLNSRDMYFAELINGCQLGGFQRIAAIILLLHLAPAPRIVTGIRYLHLHTQFT